MGKEISLLRSSGRSFRVLPDHVKSCLSLFVPAAFLVFLAATARAWLISANPGFTANHRLLCRITRVNEVPFPFLFSEETQFLVFLKALVGLKLGFERHRANLIVNATLLGLQEFPNLSTWSTRPISRLASMSV